MAEVNNVTIVSPQPGYQMEFLSSPADIVIGGAAAGVGKTFSLLLENLRHKNVKGFGVVCFRRTTPQITSEGALWDTSMSIYPQAGGRPRQSILEWEFTNQDPETGEVFTTGVKFSHLEYEKNIHDWQGSQIPLIEFDELTHFTKKMFFYLLSRNRSVCGVKPYARATCNPDPDSWVAEFISWWIDQDTGFPIPERRGVLRYFMVNGESYIWGDTKEEVIEKAWFILEPIVKKSGLDPRDMIKSVTFISGDIYQNKALLLADPSYLGNLLAQDEATQAALLHGNWKVILSDNDVYNYHAFLGMFNNKFEVEHGEKYITADIAMKGSNKFIVLGWDGWECVDIMIIDKSNGKLVITSIEGMASRLKCQNRFITFDNDGVGSFVDGFIEGAVEFNNGGTPYPNPEKPMIDKNGKILPENYANLKTQCYYRSGDNVEKGKYRISEDVANTMYDDKMTVRQRLLYERKAIKRAKADFDGKLKIIGKDEMKTMLNGDSPDLMDAFMMREIFNLNVDNSDEWVPY